jgi:glucose/arabinose dehydrogenase
MRTQGIVLSLALVACAGSGARSDEQASGNGDEQADPGSAPSDPADHGKKPPKAPNVTCAPDNGGITLPDGFCATIFADDLGKARHIAVTPKGYVFIAVQPSMPGATDDRVVSLFDADNDGVAELQETISDVGGNGIAWQDGKLYVAPNDRILRYDLPDGQMAPDDPTPVVLVKDLPATPDHPAKTVVLSGRTMFVNIGSASDSCQVQNRVTHSPGIDPCRELETRAGIWSFDADRLDQNMSCGIRVATGTRNTNAMALEPGTDMLWGAINGRDELHRTWPELFTEQDDKDLPAEEVIAITKDLDRGWPYCFYDVRAKEMKLTPEYGGDGDRRGRCASIPPPQFAMAGHSAPLGMEFSSGKQFPEAFRKGAFIANHGDRFDQHTGEPNGYDVVFAPIVDGKPAGDIVKFATGFDAGMRPLPAAAPHRPVGLAMMPDGSLLIGDDKGGRVWRVFFVGDRD